MELKEAFDIIDATLGMFRSIEEEVENGDLKDKFLLTPVYSSVENVFDADRNSFEIETRLYYNYVYGDQQFKRYIVDIRPVCSYMINEWPSPKAKKIHKLLNEVLLQCVGLCEETLGPILNVALDEGYGYEKYMRSQDSRTLETVLLDTIHEMSHALGLTEYAEADVQEEDVVITDDNRIISEDLAGQMDWVSVTQNFNPDAIKDLVRNIGKSKREKKIVVKAIFDAMSHSGELYKIPYSVDRLLDDLYRKFDKKHRGIKEAYDEENESLNLDVLMKNAIEEYLASHKATESDIDEIFAEDNKKGSEMEKETTQESATSQNDSPSAENELPDCSCAPKKCFRFPNDFTKQFVGKVVNDYYFGSYANLALIEVTLYDHQQLIKRASHTAFVKSLAFWGFIEVKDAKALDKIIRAVADKYKRLRTEGYKEWPESYKNDKDTCTKIGNSLDPSMKYQRKTEE